MGYFWFFIFEMEYLRILFSENIKEIKPKINKKQYHYIKPKEKKKDKFQNWINNNPREYSNLLLEKSKFQKITNFYEYVSNQTKLSITTVRKHFINQIK